MQIHHVGYYVTDINDAVADFQKLGYAVSTPRIFDETRKIFIQFMELASNENDMGGAAELSWSLPLKAAPSSARQCKGAAVLPTTFATSAVIWRKRF